MPSGLIPVTYGGHPINSAPFKAEIERGQGFADIYTAQVVEAEIPGRFASFVRAQPKSKDFTLNVYMHDGANTALTREAAERLLYNWFDPDKGPDYLVCKLAGSPDLRMSIMPVKLTVTSPGHFAIGCHASKPVWESVTAETATQSMTTVTPNLTLSQEGDTQAYPIITLTPTSLKTSTTSWAKRRRVNLVNKSEYPLGDPVNPDGYPIRFDISDLTAYPPEEIRLMLNGRQIPRWITADALGLWANLRLRARIIATLAQDIDANVEELLVNNPEGFSQWPLGSGFFLLDDERIGYTGLGQYAAIGLERGAGGTSNTAHSAGAVLYWIQYALLDIVYDFTGIEAVYPVASVELAERKPLIDLDESTNTQHVWHGPFINTNNDVRSRAFELTYSDDGINAQHVRVYTDPNNSSQLTFEDLTPSAGKPAFNNAELKFPVPVAVGGASLAFDVNVGPSLVLQAFVTDLEGNETRLTAQFSTGGILDSVQFPLVDPVTTLRFNARIGAISGDVSVGDFIFTAGDASGNVFVPNPFFTDHPETGAGLYVAIIYNACLHFHLDQETAIDGFEVFMPNGELGMTFVVYTDSGGEPDHPVANGTIVSVGEGLIITTFDPPLALPSGDYWFVSLDTVMGAHPTRTSASIWFGLHVLRDRLPFFVPGLPGIVRFTFGDQIADVPIPNGPQFHINDFTISPIFGVISKTTLPQADAPVLTGNKIVLPNFTAQLDGNRVPATIIGAEETNAYVLSSRIRNETTGDFLDVFFPTNLAQSVVIDCEHRTITDSETGEPIPFALTASNPDVWLYLLPDENVISYTEDGLVAVTMSVEWRRALL